MPSTVNGIGTNYVGKKNLTTREGVCQQCHKQSKLRSYDTRLWVVVLFLPIIPLGKKRVIDDCSRCTRHGVMPLDAYLQARDERLAELAAATQQDPGGIEAALAYNSALFQFHQTEEGLRHLEEIAARFSGDVDVQLYAGAVCEQQGRPAEAARFFDRAYEIDSHNPGARRARTITLIEDGQLHEARSLLDTTDREHRDPAVVFMLAEGYRKASDPQTALGLFRHLLAEHPALARDKSFRKAVRATEREARSATTILPQRSLPWKTASAVALIVAAVLSAAWVANFYIESNYPVWVVNGFPGEVRLVIDGEEEVSFTDIGRRELALAEGAHQVEVTAPWQESFEIELRRTLVQRVLSEGFTVLNPGGLAILLLEDMVYSDLRTGDFEPTVRAFAGKNAVTFREVDYPFEDFPQEITLPSGKHRVRKTRLAEMPTAPAESVWLFLKTDQAGVGLRYLERWLELAPHDDLLDAYSTLALQAGELRRAADFLEPRLAVDPVNVRWHRAFQQVAGSGADLLVERYEDLLAGRPDDPDLLYLRGRIDPADGGPFFDRALEIDPQHLFAQNAKAFNALIQGDFPTAAAQYGRLVESGRADAEIEASYDKALFAARRWDVLEPRLLANLEQDLDAVDWQRALRHVHMLVRQGRVEEARELIRDISVKERAKHEGAVFLAAWLKVQLLYATGKWEGLRNELEAEQFPELWKDEMSFWWAIETGAFASIPQAETDAYRKLLLSLAYAREGDDDLAATRLREGLPELRELGLPFQRFAEMVGGDREVTRANLSFLGAPPELKAVLLTALAVHQPRQRELLLREARTFNFELGFPHHLLASFQP